jgi:hypothetical protein
MRLRCLLRRSRHALGAGACLSRSAAEALVSANFSLISIARYVVYAAIFIFIPPLSLSFAEYSSIFLARPCAYFAHLSLKIITENSGGFVASSRLA